MNIVTVAETMKCIVCFEPATGVRPNDYFVSTQNGHVFHYCCALEFVASGSSFCPICDEDLRSHAFVKLNSKGEVAPPLPPKPGRNINGRNSSALSSSSIVSHCEDPWHLGRRENSQTQLVQPSASFCAQPDYVFKIVVLGDINVGKSSLLQRYADDRFDPIIQNTIGCDLRVKVISIAGKIVRLHLWDTAGQERHRAVVDMYLRKADGIIFCFDITDLASFHSLQDWFQFSMRCLPSDTLKIIVGTKFDLISQRVVRSHQIRSLAEGWNAQYIYTSAKDATNVEVVFRSLTALILEHRMPSSFNNASTIPCAPLIEPVESNRNNKDETIKLYNPFTKLNGKKKKAGDLHKCC